MDQPLYFKNTAFQQKTELACMKMRSTRGLFLFKSVTSIIKKEAGLDASFRFKIRKFG